MHKQQVTAEYTQEALDASKDLGDIFDENVSPMGVMRAEGGWLVTDWLFRRLMEDCRKLSDIRKAIKND